MVVGELVERRQSIIIGGGPAGYTLAIRLAQLGQQVTLVEKAQVGGSCLHEGCIPSKFFAKVAKEWASLQKLAMYGIQIEGQTFQWESAQQQLQKIQSQLTKGVEALCQKHDIERIEGTAMFSGENRIGIEIGERFELYEYDHLILATGASVERESIFESLGAHCFVGGDIYGIDKLPSSLIIYGVDPYALEVAFTMKQLGVDVHIVAEPDSFMYDSSIEKELRRQSKKKKIKWHTSEQLEATLVEERVHVKIEDGVIIEADALYTSGVKRANLHSLNAARLNFQMNGDDLSVNERYETSQNHIYALGEMTGREGGASRAIADAKRLASIIVGGEVLEESPFFPLILHTNPPVVSVGLREQEMDERHIASQIPLMTSGIAKVNGTTDGFVKVITNKETTLIEGLHMIGEGAIELSAHFTQLLDMVAKEEDVLYSVQAHLSIQESVIEAVENLRNLAIHQ